MRASSVAAGFCKVVKGKGTVLNRIKVDPVLQATDLQVSGGRGASAFNRGKNCLGQECFSP